MKHKQFCIMLVYGFCTRILRSPEALIQREIEEKHMAKTEDNLVVVWSSGDRDVALKMVFMYTLNAKLKGWWEDVVLVIWGPSARLLSEDTELQEYLARMKSAGIVLEACRACADMYGVSENLEKMDIEVKYMGTPLTSYLKEGRKIITF